MDTQRTLALAQKQALSIHVSIATMKKTTDIFKEVDELLHTLTGLPRHFDEHNPSPAKSKPKEKEKKKKVKPQNTIPNVDPATESAILKAIRENPGITQKPLAKHTKFTSERTRAALYKLLHEKKITSPNGFRGPRRYSIATPL